MDKDLSFVAFESVCSRFERTIKRLWILVIILTVLLVGTNCAWLLYESQFQYVETSTESYEADATDGGVAIANGEGVVNNIRCNMCHGTGIVKNGHKKKSN